jgi:phenylalanyl-tRNA synthetase alpha chain
MTESLDDIVAQAERAFAQSATAPDLENAKARFLGKQGAITERMKALATVEVEVKKQQGAVINAAKQAIEAALAARRSALAEAELNERLAAQRLDVTLPGRVAHRGGLHPVTQTWMRIEEIFASIGFDVADGPEIETDWYSFTALNNPENHPARSMQDTFYVDARDSDGRLLCLRPHTSPMQVRYAQQHRGAIRVICPGKTYRVDSDATHSPMFHQFEGLWMEEGISLADLKSVFTQFLVQYFETDRLNVRFRPSYFPFTEPSAEVDVMFAEGALAGRWLEVAGSGQVHPQVVRNFGLDPEKTVGFAFGSGIERLAMLRHGVSDLRLFYENDLRFLRQFQR